METIIGVLIHCFPVKKKTGNLIYGTAVIQPPRVVFGGVPEPHPRQLFDYQETDYNSRNIRAAVKVF